MWHKILGLANFDNLVKMSSKVLVKDMPKLARPDKIIYKGCQQGKKSKVKFSIKEYSTTKPLEIIHTSFCGPIMKREFQGEIYFMLLIDDYTRMAWVTFLKEKAQEFVKFKIFS